MISMPRAWNLCLSIKVEELPAPVTTQSGRASKTPRKFWDYVCSEVRNQITQDLTSHTGTRTPTQSESELAPHAVALGFQQLRISTICIWTLERDRHNHGYRNHFKQDARTRNRWRHGYVSEEELLRDNTQVVSTTVKKATTLSQQRWKKQRPLSTE